MNIIIPTCNAYAHLVVPCVDSIRRFWDAKISVTVLHYTETGADVFPSDVDLIDMGKQPDGKIWTNGIAGVMHTLPRTFILMLEDYHVVAPVNQLEVLALWELVASGQFRKAELTGQAMKLPPNENWYHGLLLRGQTSRYRNSLQAAIWDKHYFESFLQHDWTPWQFEIEGMKRAYNDGALILGPKHDVVKYKNAMQGERT
jgi:hypothetical protein